MKSQPSQSEAIKHLSKRFDISKAGPVGDTNVPGVGNPKTWEFYFTNYCYNRINFLVIEQRE